MKTKTFLLLCLLSGVTFTRLSAQNSRDVYNFTVPELVVTIDVVCDGVLVDQLQNITPYLLKCRDKYKNGEWIYNFHHLNNAAFGSLWTDEIFSAQVHEKVASVNTGLTLTDEWSSNFIGNKGSHYIIKGFLEMDLVTEELTMEFRSVCH